MHTICIEFILNTYISVANKRRETCKFISNNDKKLMWQTISDKVEKCGNETSVPGVMAQILRALPVLEDPVRFPALKRSSSQSFVTNCSLTIFCNCSSWGSVVIFWPLGTCTHMAFIHTPTHT